MRGDYLNDSFVIRSQHHGELFWKGVESIADKNNEEISIGSRSGQHQCSECNK